MARTDTAALRHFGLQGDTNAKDTWMRDPYPPRSDMAVLAAKRRRGGGLKRWGDEGAAVWGATPSCVGDSRQHEW